MSDNTKNQVDNEDLQKQAYFELCQIINLALQNQNIDELKYNIAVWKNKYKDLKFTSPYREKILALLNQIPYYIDTIQKEIYELKKILDEFNFRKAYQKLYHIIDSSDGIKDIKLLKKKIDEWKSKYDFDKFNDYYKNKIKQITSDAHVSRTAFDQDKAFDELRDITNKTYRTDNPDDLGDLSKNIEEWQKKYPQKYNVTKFEKHNSDIKRLTSKEFLHSIVILDIIDSDEKVEESRSNINEFKDVSMPFHNTFNEQSEYFELAKILKNPKDINSVFNWTYKNRNNVSKFKDPNIIGRILQYSSSTFPIPKKGKVTLHPLNTDLSFDEFNDIDNIKRTAITYFFSSLNNSAALSKGDVDIFNSIHNKSEESNKIVELNNSMENEYPLLLEPKEKSDFDEIPELQEYIEYSFPVLFENDNNYKEQSENILDGSEISDNNGDF